MDQGSILGIIGIVVSVSGAILALINHTRIRSNCFGIKTEVSLDVDKTDIPSNLRISLPGLPESPKKPT
jgi:hypothetical protein